MSNVHSRALSRRSFLSAAAATSILGLPGSSRAQQPTSDRIDLDLRRAPDSVALRSDTAARVDLSVERSGQRWTSPGVELSVIPGSDSTDLRLHAPRTSVTHVHLRWQAQLPAHMLVLGDAWERSYGDLEWLPVDAGRVLPWYFVAQTARSAVACGVRAGASSLAFWQVDPHGVSLWLDIRNGGDGVLLGDRILQLATVIQQPGQSGQTAFALTEALCHRMANGTAIPSTRGQHALQPLYGSNDWYYAYGKNTADGILRDADLMSELAPAGGVRPCTVVDDGYQDRARFPDMARLASGIRSRGVTPGVWIRPLRAPSGTPEQWLVPSARFGERRGHAAELAFDPSVPEARAAVMAVVTEAGAWGYDLLKHDFTTYDLLGQWGSGMGASPTLPGWHFRDRTRTNAEILSALYRDIRAAAGQDRILLGCNTVGHLAVGLFDAQRTGDDVSGRLWERTRRMGVNTLAFRLPQHRAFFAIDADCVPITHDIPWENTRQWLDLVARSGTVLLVSPEPGAIGPQQKHALREAFAQCAINPAIQPLDWTDLKTPEQWLPRHQTGVSAATRYTWTGPEGADPFWRS